MIVLGICDSQDSGAALFVDGKLVAAVNEERLNREKMWGGLPVLSAMKVLEIAGIVPTAIDTIVVGTSVTPNILARAFRDMHQPLRKWNGQFRYVLNAFLSYQTAGRILKAPLAMETAVAKAVLTRDLRRAGLAGDVVMVDHHEAHAWGAWASSGFDAGLVVTIDGLGDGLSATISVGEGDNGLRRIHRETGYSAITLYYSRLTEFLGYRAIRDEGKVNALAAHDTTFSVMDIARKVLSHKNGCLNVENHILPKSLDDWPFSEMRKYPPEAVASSFQKNFEDVVTDWIRYWLKQSGTDRVAVAGGAFANVKLNQRIAAMPECRELFVFPHMGDGGLAVGGAMAYLKSKPAAIRDVFMGPEFSPGEIEGALRSAGVKYEVSSDIEMDIARLLADHKVVARFDGRMEFGPRALGNRSILVEATDPTTIDWLNVKLKRNKVMPFAPAIHEDVFSACIVGGDKAPLSSQFMTVAFDVTPDFKKRCGGAVHVDDTARPQKVTRSANPAFARILEKYRELTGLPAVINTSFNMHEEPIVCTPDDAINAFRLAELDALTLGPYLVTRDRDGGRN